jgi:DNA-binding transcriptional MerR regulator
MRAGEVATRSGVSRKALRLYEAMGILPSAARAEAGYRVYGDDTLQLLGFVTQARRLGFSLAEIRDILSIRRSDGLPCPHVQELVLQKAAVLDRTLRSSGRPGRRSAPCSPRGAPGGTVPRSSARTSRRRRPSVRLRGYRN